MSVKISCPIVFTVQYVTRAAESCGELWRACGDPAESCGEPVESLGRAWGEPGDEATMQRYVGTLVKVDCAHGETMSSFPLSVSVLLNTIVVIKVAQLVHKYDPGNLLMLSRTVSRCTCKHYYMEWSGSSESLCY